MTGTDDGQKGDEIEVSPEGSRVLAPPGATYTEAIGSPGQEDRGSEWLSKTFSTHLHNDIEAENSGTEEGNRGSVGVDLLEKRQKLMDGVGCKDCPPVLEWKGKTLPQLGGSLRRVLQPILEELHSKASSTAGDLFPLPLSACSEVGPSKQDWLWIVLACLNEQLEDSEPVPKKGCAQPCGAFGPGLVLARRGSW